MGLVDELSGSTVCIDTAPVIYFIEKHDAYFNILRPIFLEIDAGNIQAITSTVTLLEVLVQPLRKGNKSLADQYRDILLYSENLTTFEILHEVSEKSAEIRASYAIKTPDAIQIAVGLLFGADSFLTNDPVLKKVSDMNVFVLDDFLTI